MTQEIKQGHQQFYVGEDEQNAQAVITFKQVDNNEIDIDHTGVATYLFGKTFKCKYCSIDIYFIIS